MCQREICSDISFCNPSSSCSNCTIPLGLNCICYEGKVYIIISILDVALFFPQNVVVPVWMEEDVSTIIPASVLHTGLENTVNKVCHPLPMLTHIQTWFFPEVLLPVIWPAWMEEHVVVLTVVHVLLNMMGYNVNIKRYY